LWRAAARSTGAASGRTAATRTTTSTTTRTTAWTTAWTPGSSAWSTIRRGGTSRGLRSDDQWASSRLSNRGGCSGWERLSDGDHRSGRSPGRSTKAGSHDDLGSFLPLRRDPCEILFTESLGSGGGRRFVYDCFCRRHLCNGVILRLRGFDQFFCFCFFGRSLDPFRIFGGNFGFRGAGCFFDRGIHDWSFLDRGIHDRDFHDRDFHDRGFHDRGFHDRGFHDRGFHDFGNCGFDRIGGGIYRRFDHGFFDRSLHDFTRGVRLVSRFRLRDFLGFFGIRVGNGDDP
jgi:hypothetical protein